MPSESPISQKYIIGFVLVVLAIPLSMMGLIILALPMGLYGGFLLIKEMFEKYRQ